MNLFFKNTLLVEIDELVHIDMDPYQEKKRQKEIEKYGYYIIRINLGKKDFNDYEEFGRAWTYITKSIKESTKKALIDILSKRLLELKFEKHNSIKTKCFKRIVKKYYQQYRNE